MAIAITLKQYLAKKGVDYDLVPHPRTPTSLAAAHAARVPDDRVAKSVILEDEQGFLMAVVPACHRVELGTLHHALHRNLGLATEPEVVALFQDCEIGAIPAVGPAYGVPVIVDDSLTERPDIYFEAGDHRELIHMDTRQFKKLLPRVMHGRFSHRAGA
ncbi:MAG: aminoacyl-tRNA deacylase [Candidatus Muproteobacteria bacterium RBG_16_64_11]|uniref:Aminoacyl-tRNA deacylase n=1 Tax=Candidatus Muproteobacteria bacterium RBG_16_64_11 TaxID=1817758 RepID=A0A1F6TC21_9PROT|nr:MAG: aminoacyl-tRNA deacylase [Candidatus Muproteobacteria bacterium RBG_16_64_11]